MTTEISKELVCILMRSGIELWIEKDRVPNLIKEMETKRFVNIDNSIVNVADISGVFPAKEMEENTRRKNGQWKDKKGNWQDKGTRSCPKCGNILPWGKQCGFCA